MSKEDAKNIKLLALDWDGTVVPCHMSLVAEKVFDKSVRSPIIYRNGISPQEQLGAMFNPKYNADLVPTALGEWLGTCSLPKALETANLIRTSVEKGIKVAIVTLNGHPDAIYLVLEHLGIAQEILENVVVVCNGYDEIKTSRGASRYVVPKSKNTHIKLAMQYFGMEKDMQAVLYVDDDLKYLESASDVGCTTVFAELRRQEKWLSDTQALIDKAGHIGSFLAHNDICAMNIEGAGQWEIDNPPVQEVVTVSAFMLGALKPRKKSSASEVKIPSEDGAVAAASSVFDMQKLGGVVPDVFGEDA